VGLGVREFSKATNTSYCKCWIKSTPAILFEAATISGKYGPLERITTACHADNAAGRISPELTVGYIRRCYHAYFRIPYCDTLWAQPALASRELSSLYSLIDQGWLVALIFCSRSARILIGQNRPQAPYAFTERNAPVLAKKSWY